MLLRLGYLRHLSSYNAFFAPFYLSCSLLGRDELLVAGVSKKECCPRITGSL